MLIAAEVDSMAQNDGVIRSGNWIMKWYKGDDGKLDIYSLRPNRKSIFDYATQYAKDWYYRGLYNEVGDLGALDYLAVHGTFFDMKVAGSIYTTDDNTWKLLGHIPKEGGFVILQEYRHFQFVPDIEVNLTNEKGEEWSPIG